MRNDAKRPTATQCPVSFINPITLKPKPMSDRPILPARPNPVQKANMARTPKTIVHTIISTIIPAGTDSSHISPTYPHTLIACVAATALGTALPFEPEGLFACLKEVRRCGF